MNAREIRAFERALLARTWPRGTTHTCIGQEVVAVSVCACLLPADVVVSNHRCHGHYLARTGDAAGLLAEIEHGVGGSQHLVRTNFFTNGVQGSIVPLAVGMAYALRGTGRLVCCFVGDGTFGEGAVYEALNLAEIWRVPLLLVVEVNEIAQSTPTADTTAPEGLPVAQRIGRRIAAFWPREVRRLDGAGRAVDAARDGLPSAVVAEVPRLGPHSKGDDTREEVPWHLDPLGETP